MKEYHKIESLFERDMEGTRKLIHGKFRNPLVEYLKDNTWIFTEKVDGTNIRILWDGHKVSFGKRTNNTSIPVHLLNYLTDKFISREAEELFEQKFGENEVMFYGEGFGEKIQKGGGDYGEVSLALFDIEIGGVYLERENIEELARAFGINCVPVVLMGTIQDGIDFIKSKPKSVIAKKERLSEGIVGVPAQRIKDARGNRVVVKIKVEDFR